MTRKRKKKSHAKTPSPALQHQARKTPPAAQIVATRIASGGVDYMKQNLVRIMTDSVKLAEEPEFIDLYLDDETAAEASQRWLKKYKKRLAAAEKKSPDAYHEVYNEMRIEVVAELATPAFRKDVDERLQALLDRLMATEDLEKLEMVLLLKPLLGVKSVPWGLCGLIVGIYNRTMQKAIQEYEEDKVVYDAVVEAFKAEGEDSVDVVKIIESPEKLEQLGEKLFAAKPGLRQRAEKQVWDMVRAFEKELAEGRVTLDLFTQAELVLPFQRLQAHGEPFTQAQPTEEIRQLFFDAILQAINEIMTLERFQRLRKDVQSTAKAWLRERQKWAAALQFELGWLDGEQYEENKFVVSAFVGQMMRLGKDQKPAQKQKKHAN
jgi:hypothetical protein